MSDQGRVVNFTEFREQKLEEKRRKNERVFINHVLGVFGVTGNNSMHQIELVDVSDDGCAFQVPFNPEKPWPTTDGALPIRLYFSQDTFLEIPVMIQNSKSAIQNGQRYVRYGCRVDTTSASYKAYQSFVSFLKTYAEVARKDNGNVSIFFV